MSKFQMRTSCPSGYNKNYMTTGAGGWNTCIVGNPTKSDANVLANCVGYASGRFNELINIARGTTGCTYKTLNCNAENFIERAQAAGLKIGQVPKRGAIACAMAGNTLSGNDGAGHVWIVEEVYDNNHHYSSESGYQSAYFWNSHRYNNNGRWGLGAGYTFRGFIYLPDDVQAYYDNEPKPEPIPSKPLKFKEGDKVYAEGNLYFRANDTTPAGSTSRISTIITRTAPGTRHPYNTTGDLGWMSEHCFTLRNTSEWPKYHVVTSTDTLSGIAEKYYGNGDYDHYMFIARANNISNPDIIYDGTKLTIPKYTGSSSSFNIGDRVLITGGYASSNDAGSAPNTKMKGHKAYIVDKYPKGRYPYQLGNKAGDKSSSNTIGFANENSITKA